jgi:tRNA A37 threonylcarbamoyladenosine modification protein TsaB
MVVNILKVYYDKLMAKLVFNLQPAKENGRSAIEIILKNKDKTFKSITSDTDKLLPTLDKLLKKNKIDIESLKDINVEIANGAGLTSTRIVSSISKALSSDLS